jgi:hypothetical protein
LLKLGIYNYENLWWLIVYMIPEILILTLIMLNEIHLRLIGLYYRDENSIEPILDGIQRVRNGDEAAVEMHRLEQSNMFMERYFIPREEVIKKDNEFRQNEISDISYQLTNVMDPVDVELKKESLGISNKELRIEEVAAMIYEENHEDEPKGEEMMEIQLSSTSDRIWKTSKQFDLDLQA